MDHLVYRLEDVLYARSSPHVKNNPVEEVHVKVPNIEIEFFFWQIFFRHAILGWKLKIAKFLHQRCDMISGPGRSPSLHVLWKSLSPINKNYRKNFMNV